MSVRKRAGRAKPWIATVAAGLDRQRRRRRTQRGFETRREALAWEREQHAQQRRTQRVGRQLPTLGQLLAERLHRGEHLLEWSPRHVANTRRLIAGPLAELRDYRVDDLTIGDLEAWLVDQRRARISLHTLRQARNAIRAAFNDAIRRELIDRNPADLLQIASPPRKPPRALRAERPDDDEPSEVERFLTAINGHRLAPLWIVSMTLALRPSEALGLRWSDVDREASRVTIARTLQYSEGSYYERDRTKTGAPRVVQLPEVTTRALETQRLNQIWEQGGALNWQPSERVFTNQSGGPLHEPYARRQLRNVLEAAGLPRLTQYQLRHTGATWLLSLGVPVEQIREIMGHSTIQMTLGYAQISEALQRDAMRRLDDYLDEGAPDG